MVLSGRVILSLTALLALTSNAAFAQQNHPAHDNDAVLCPEPRSIAPEDRNDALLCPEQLPSLLPRGSSSGEQSVGMEIIELRRTPAR